MPKWRITAFDGASETDLDQIVSGSETDICMLLKRLIAHHLTVREIIASVGSDARFKIKRDKWRGEPIQLSTTGTDRHYLAVETRDASRKPRQRPPA
jgi:hypothetical protein